MNDNKVATKPLTVRFEPLLLERIRLIAKFERRSLNNQILYFLAHSVENFDRNAPPEYELDLDHESLTAAAGEELALEESEESESSESDPQPGQSA